MTKPTWILETNVFSEDCFDRIVAHLSSNDIPFHTVRVIPMAHEVEGRIPQVEPGPVVVYGSIGTQLLAQRQGWTPGVWSTPDFHETVLRDRLGRDYLNHDLVACKFRDVLEHVGESFFIKPDSDTKEFAGTVMTREKFGEWTQGMLRSGYVDQDIFDLDVVVSSPKEIGNEWRLVVVDGKISDACVYKRYQRVMPQRELPEPVRALAERVILDFAPAPVFVIDVCEAENGFKVIEVNTFNSAGLYAIDVGRVIDDIGDYIDRTHSINNAMGN